MLSRIYYFPLDSGLNETSPSVSVELTADGTADISRLPAELQDRLRAFGVPDPTHVSMLYPKDGEAFLEALLEASNLYWRFRSQPDPRHTV